MRQHLAPFCATVFTLCAARSDAANLLVTSSLDGSLASGATTCTTNPAVTDGSACTLRAALELASAGDDISFAAGVTFITLQSELGVGTDVTIKGTAESPVVIDGGGTTALLSVTKGTIVLAHLTFQRGLGAATVISLGARGNCDVTIEDSRIVDNVSGDDGAIVSSVCPLTLRRTIVANNQSELGAIVIQREDRTLTIESSSFSANNAIATADHGGGAVRSNSPTVISDSVFTNNTAFEGAAVVAGSDVTIVNSEFRSNALLPPGPRSVLSDRCGGAVLLAVPPVNQNLSRFALVTNSIFADNSAHHCGGALASRVEAQLTFERVAFTHNSAGYAGGALFLSTNGSVLLRQSSITRNSLTGTLGAGTARGGAGLFLQKGLNQRIGAGASLTLRNVTVASNQSAPAVDQELFPGGGLALSSAALLRLNHVTLVDNSTRGSAGAGLFASASVNALEIGNSVIGRNQDLNSGLASDCDSSSASAVSFGFNVVGGGCPLIGSDVRPDNGDAFKLGTLVASATGLEAVFPEAGSPAVDHASDILRGATSDDLTSDYAAERVDQLGSARPLHGGLSLRADSGAIEFVVASETGEPVADGNSNQTGAPPVAGATAPIVGAFAGGGLGRPGCNATGDSPSDSLGLWLWAVCVAFAHRRRAA